jgi:glycosyltransferase involved in cell wall biosynthesis
MTSPVVSIVTSVHNGGERLRPSLESVLTQSLLDLELIVVDDGSHDDSRAVLEDLARQDGRVRPLVQENQGLTRALIRGCAAARGQFIARHDSDDCSLPGRLERQVTLLRSDPRLALVSCWSRILGPRGEHLVNVQRPADSSEATRQLLESNAGPFHGSVMFRRDAYERVGGYRPAFRYAQDWDLWLRLIDAGRIAYVPEFLYALHVGEASISARHRDQQVRLLQLALACRAARLRGESETTLLGEAERVSSQPALPTARAEADTSYFIGRCLAKRRDRRAIPYLWRSACRQRWMPRPWLALAAAWLLCRGHPTRPDA